MTRGTRAFAMTSLVALLGASLLHLLVLLGMGSVWAAMIHLTLFGWITGIILAVNYHTLPVFSGRTFPYPRLIDAHCVTFAAAVTISTMSLLAGWRIGISAGLLLELVAALLFLANTMLLFLRGTPHANRPPTPPIPDQPHIDRIGTQATKTAGLSLPLSLGLLLAAQLESVSAAWVLAAEHLATLGWVMLMITGVAYHVLPRFSGRALRGARWAKAHMHCHLLALLLIVTALGFGWTRVFAVGGGLMGVALGLFAWTVWPTLAVVRSRSSLIQVTFKERPR